MTGERTYLVTGASGFVGRTLCQRLLGAGRVRALFRRKAEGPWDEAFRLDLAEERSFSEVVEGVDTVFHLAAKTDDSKTAPGDVGVFQRVNFEGTRRLLETAVSCRVARFVFLSSIKAMGAAGGGRLDERAPARPSTPYGRSKRGAEEIVLASEGIPHVCVLRSCPVYGPGSKGNLARMIGAMVGGVFPPIPDTKNTRSMIHVEDLADALILCAENEAARGRVFIVTDGREYSTRQIYEWVCECAGRTVPPWSVPPLLFRAAGKLGDGLSKLTGRAAPFDSGMVERLLGSAFYDSTLIARTLGYSPKRGLKETIPEMVRCARGLA